MYGRGIRSLGFRVLIILTGSSWQCRQSVGLKLHFLVSNGQLWLDRISTPRPAKGLEHMWRGSSMTSTEEVPHISCSIDAWQAEPPPPKRGLCTSFHVYTEKNLTCATKNLKLQNKAKTFQIFWSFLRLFKIVVKFYERLFWMFLSYGCTTEKNHPPPPKKYFLYWQLILTKKI